MSRNFPLTAETVELLENYKASNPKYVTFEYTDPGRSVERTQELEKRYGIDKKENVVIVDAGAGNFIVVSGDKLADVDLGDEAAGRAPRVTLFKAERVLTRAMLDLVEGKYRRTYYAQGHGEPSLAKGKALAQIGDQLTAEHLTVAELNLLNTESVPADATVLMLIGARYDLTDREVTMLNNYWDKGGRLLILLDPESSTPKLAGFLSHLGVRSDDDRLLAQVNVLGVRRLIKSAVALFAGDTTVATRLADVTPQFYGNTQSLTLTPESGASTGLKVGPLLIAAKGFWGETDYRDMETAGAENDPAKDKQYPLNIAATVEKGAVGDQRVQVTASRLVVVGNSSFLDPNVLDQPLYDFFISSINWLDEH